LSLGFQQARDDIRNAPIEDFKPLAKGFEAFVGSLSTESRAVFERQATETRTDPCNLLQRSRFIYKGLNDGSIRYDGIDPNTKEIKLKFQNGDPAGTIYGGHISAMVQYHGAGAVEAALQNAGFDQQGLQIAKDQLALAESGTRIMKSDLATPVLRQTMPVTPEVWRCDFGAMS
jgi:hypothetical protein